MYKKLFTSMFEGPKKEEKPIAKSPEKIPIYAGNDSNEDPDPAQDAKTQAEVNERVAKLLDKIKSGVIEKGESVEENEKRKLLRLSHDKWIEGAKKFAKDVGQIVISSVAVDLILRQLGIELPLPVIVAISSASIVSFEKKKDKK